VSAFNSPAEAESGADQLAGAAARNASALIAPMQACFFVIKAILLKLLHFPVFVLGDVPVRFPSPVSGVHVVVLLS